MPHRASSIPMILFIVMLTIITTTILTFLTHAYAQDPALYKQTVTLRHDPSVKPLRVCDEAMQRADSQLKAHLEEEFGITFPKQFHFVVSTISYQPGSCTVTVWTTIKAVPPPTRSQTYTGQPVYFPTR